ncbi:helix-turn-helix domain-containing protein [Streptomyces daliensis]|uniref:Helix-turn-helix transcriptional regulator n=1 Tax=Streptomyces daliensis TaxID=299421 RepID=A0A8T4IWR3_9ACTN|nr:helix-turn-helix transcriptional regulator [Streptomyces daliensis]
MTTDFQTGRLALGARLRELRVEAGLNGKELAARLGWQASKVSRLENGKQTASPSDLEAWAEVTCRSDASADLHARLYALDLQQRSWRRQLATGHRAVQDKLVVEYQNASTVRAYEATVVPGLFQTPDYARHLLLLNAELHGTTPDTDDAVRARMRRQEVLYEAGKMFRVLLWEGALHALICPREVLAAQLDRLVGLIGLDRVALGIVPFGAAMKITPKHGFWIFDDARVSVETISAEARLDAPEDVDLYMKAWERLDASAVYGAKAHRLIARARASLGLS